MRALNAKYLHRDYVTDVLSFRYDDEDEPGPDFLGEVVIAPDAAVSHSRIESVPVETEMRRLLIHGTLHLLGYDHEVDGGEMIRLQERLVRRSSLLARKGPLLGRRRAR